MVIVVITSATALIIKAQGDSFDLIKAAKQLYSENRRDDALVLVQTFKGITERGNDELAKIEKQLEYGTFEMFKSALWNGVTKGEVYDHYSGLGAITADMCLWGDIRDLVIEGYKIIYLDSNHEKQVVIIPGAGVSSFCYPMIDGAGVLAKNTGKYLNTVLRPPSGGLLRQFVSGDLSPNEGQKIWELFKKTTGRSPEPQPSFPTYQTRSTSIRYLIS
jgi:hypothetical protein